eukprot:1872983-Ditylum_brightwellii.AAC.1
MENIEWTIVTFVPMVSPELAYKHKDRSTSPQTETHKERHKSLEQECNTLNVITGSQEQQQSHTPTQKKELRPRCSQTAD